jgi:hypothetical protein
MIRDCRRGLDLATIELTHDSGHVLRVVAEGVTDDERRRHRETLLQWLVESGIALVVAEARLR